MQLCGGNYAADLGYADPAQTKAWIDELSEIARMLQALRRHLSSLTPDD